MNSSFAMEVSVASEDGPEDNLPYRICLVCSEKVLSNTYQKLSLVGGKFSLKTPFSVLLSILGFSRETIRNCEDPESTTDLNCFCTECGFTIQSGLDLLRRIAVLKDELEVVKKKLVGELKGSRSKDRRMLKEIGLQTREIQTRTEVRSIVTQCFSHCKVGLQKLDSRLKPGLRVKPKLNPPVETPETMNANTPAVVETYDIVLDELINNNLYPSDLRDNDPGIDAASHYEEIEMDFQTVSNAPESVAHVAPEVVYEEPTLQSMNFPKCEYEIHVTQQDLNPPTMENCPELVMDCPKTKSGCQMCSKIFANPEILQLHILESHSPGLIDEIKTMFFRCKFCKEKLSRDGMQQSENEWQLESKNGLLKITFNTFAELCDAHFIQCLKKVKPKRYKYPSRKKRMDDKDRKRVYTPRKQRPMSGSTQCPICLQKFSTEFYHRKHKKFHNQPNLCPLCDAVCISDRALSMHLNKFHGIYWRDGQYYICNYCLEVFTAPEQKYNEDGSRAPVEGLKDFINAHLKCEGKTIPVDRKCISCEFVPKSAQTLMGHLLRRHNDCYRYFCEICGAKFVYGGELTNHLTGHKEIKDFPCPTCGRAFRYPHILAMHERIHTGELPYVCETCGSRFRRMTSLRKHEGIHNTELKVPCPICGKMFRCRNNVSNHIYSFHRKQRKPKSKQNDTSQHTENESCASSS